MTHTAYSRDIESMSSESSSFSSRLVNFDGETEMETVNSPGVSSSQTCDLCKAGARIFYCPDHSAYFCILCDQDIHSDGFTGPQQQHGRLWVCNSCEEAPADLICEADAAFLCKSCDDEIHCANMLAQRHVRVPVRSVPCITSDQDEQANQLIDFGDSFLSHEVFEEIEDETESWLLLDPVIPDESICPEYRPQDDSNHWDNCMSLEETKQQEDELVINNLAQLPVLVTDAPLQQQTKIAAVKSYATPPMGSSKMFSADSRIVPYCMDSMNREAKVLRYKEKKKARKYANKVRYASRKAYAESRPRVKGRFMSKLDIELQVDRMFSMEEYSCVLF